MDPEDKSDKTGSTESQRPDKPKIIRNREVDKAAKALAEDHVLPLPPGEKLSWDQMQEYLALLTPAMWDHLSIYVYRLRPKIRRQLSNPHHPKYIDCLGEPFTMDYFIGRHGGGKYMLQANDTEKKNSKYESHKIFVCFLDLDEVKHPPILDYAELELDARENQSYITWLRNQGILDEKGNQVQQSASNNNTSPNNANIVKEILDFVKDRPPQAPTEGESLGKAIGNILVERMKQDDPSKQIATMKELLVALKDDPSRQLEVMTGWLNVLKEMRSDGSTAAVYDKLIAMQAEHNKTVLGMMDRIFQNQQQQQNQPRTALDEFDKVFSLLDRARQWGGGSGKRSGWEVGYDIAKDIALPAVQTFGSIITNIMALRRGQAPPAPGVPGSPAVPVSFDPYANPTATAAYASTIRNQTPPAPAPAPAPAPQPAAPPAAAATAPGSNPELLGIFQQYGNLVLNALNNGTPGYDFADWVSGLLGNGTHAMIANQGEDAIATTMLSISEFAVFGEPRIRTFVHEFVHFQEFLSEAEEEESMDPDEIDVSRVYRPPQRAQTARP